MGLFATLLHYSPLYVANGTRVNARILKKRGFSVRYIATEGLLGHKNAFRKPTKKQFFNDYCKVLNEVIFFMSISYSIQIIN